MRGTQIFQIIRTMNITKAIAEQVAEKMVKPISERIDSENYYLNEMVKDIAERNIPKNVYDTYKTYPKYFNTTRFVVIVNGSQLTRINTKEFYPCCGCGSVLNIECTPEESEKAYKIQERIKGLKDEYARTYNSIVDTLLGLRTSKKVKESFPDAYEHIREYEEKVTTAVALPVESIMKTINKYRKE